MIIKGVGIGRGVAVGPVIRMAQPLPEPSDAPRAEGIAAESEIARVEKSLALVNADLNRRAEEAANGDEGAKQAAPILQAVAMFASDPSLAESIKGLIQQGKTAERAVLEGFAAVEDMFRAIGGYQAERAADLHDVGQRVIADLMGGARHEQDSRHRHLAGRPDLAHRYSGARSWHCGGCFRSRSRKPDRRHYRGRERGQGRTCR